MRTQITFTWARTTFLAACQYGSYGILFTEVMCPVSENWEVNDSSRDTHSTGLILPFMDVVFASPPSAGL